jgi:hypothetical protein
VRGVEPGLLGVGDRHPRELACGAPAQGAGFERAQPCAATPGLGALLTPGGSNAI